MDTLQCQQIKDNRIIKSIITHKKLFEYTYGQNVDINSFTVDNSWNYSIVCNFNNIVGLIQHRPMTKMTVEVHPYVLPKYWHTDMSTLLIESVHKYVAKQGFKNVFSTAPANCTRALKFAKKVGYIPCGMIKDGVVYNNYLVSLILYNYTIRG